MVSGGDSNPPPADDSTGGTGSDADSGTDGSGTDGPVATDGPDGSGGSEAGETGEDCDGTTCDANATCEVDTCVCGAGFEGDGETCTDIDGCADGPCFDGVICTDVAAPDEGYTCDACPTGYEGDGEVCTDIDGCVDNPCFDGVVCDDVPAPGEGYSCGACPAGFEGDGESCADIDGCAGSPCYPGVSCDDVPAPGDGFDCGDCPVGTYGDGIDCVTATVFEVGGLGSSSVLGPYFRANGFVADGDGTLVEFEQYLGLAGACNLDFYVFEAPTPGGALTQVWRDTVVAPAGTAYFNSGPMAVPIVNGNYYALGVGWNCTATYYWQSGGAWAGFDAGVGLFENNRWDNAYPGPSDFYTPPNTGTSSTTYPQRIFFAE